MPFQKGHKDFVSKEGRKTMTKQPWEKEFEKLKESFYDCSGQGNDDECGYYPDWDKIKSFIQNLLKQEEANWMAEIHDQVKAKKLELLESLKMEESEVIIIN